MAKSSSYWDKRALNRLSDAEKTGETYTKRIKNIYNQAFKNIQRDIEDVYRNYSKDTGIDVEKLKSLLSKKETDKMWKTLKRQGLDKYIKDNYKSRISRLEQIQAQIYAKAKLIYPQEELQQTMCYKGVINDSYYKAVYDTQMGTGYDFSFHKIDNKLINSLLSENWSGGNYSNRIWGNTDILANNISSIIGGALSSGQDIEKTTRQLRERFNVAKYYAERLVRTETNHFNNLADAMAYEEMGVDKYVFVATLDSRTSEICQAMDNKVFKYSEREDGVNYPPLHPNCRSKTRGYLDEEAEKNLKRRARNPYTGKNEIINNISYKKWAKENGLIKPATINSKNTVLNKRLGFVDESATLTFIPEKSIITNTKVIAGANVKSKFRNAEKYAETYGGDAKDYSKVAGKIESSKYIFDIHFVTDNKGNEYDFKIKNRTLKGDKK